MKRPYLKILGLLVIVLAAGLIFTSIQSNKKFKFQKSAEQLHSELLSAKHFMSPDLAQEIISQSNEKYTFVDLRNPREFANFHIDGAINVPMQRVLDDEYISFLKSDKIKVLYSDESIKADQVKVLLTQYGYDNILVLQGGASYWKDHMVTKDLFKSKGEYDDEKLKFDPEKLKI